jgi:hypothetical protein
MTRRRTPVLALAIPKGLGAALARLYPRFALACRATPKPASWQPIRDEKTEQRQIKQMLDSLGIAWYDTSQPFHAAITPGVPDLICFKPLIDGDSPPWRLFVIEVKRRGESQTPAQRLFEQLCLWADIPYILGSSTEVAEFLGLENAQ